MDKVYEELDVVKGEVEKLREECRTKTEMTESLRKAHIDQLSKLQEAKLEIDRQANELFVKSEEIFEIKKLYDDIKSNLHEKESCVQNLSSAHEKQISVESDIQKLDEENRIDQFKTSKVEWVREKSLRRPPNKRDEEIGELRNILQTKEALFKDTKCKNLQLEQENQDLRRSLKELQESQLQGTPSTSVLKKLKRCMSELNGKEKHIDELEKDKRVNKLEESSDCSQRFSQNTEQEKRQYYQIAEDKDNTIEILQTKISCLEQKLLLEEDMTCKEVQKLEVLNKSLSDSRQTKENGCCEDVELVRHLDKILENPEEENEGTDERTPLVELNR
uniref:Uncharacterized protein n=1 Tax=Solanum lycopersicum TaxID=4081 RepID=A0A3Q7IF69_SOLLC